MTARRGDRRMVIRRRGDKLDRWANRAALGIMVLLVFFGIRANQHRVDQINAERARNVRLTCEDINRRHDQTIATLDAVILKRSKSEKQSKLRRQQIRQSRETTVLLINALTPKRDCDALVRNQVKTK